MRGLLNAMGATLWGTIAITLAAAIAVLGYRASLSSRLLDPSAAVHRHGQAANQRGAAANPGVATLQTEPDSALVASPEEPSLIGHYLPPAASGPRVISRVIAKEMAAAQNALQAHQWQEALIDLEAAEQRPGLTPFDQKTIYNFKGFADVKLNNLKAAQGEFEDALASGDATAEETTQWNKTLFSIAASTQQYQKAIDYGKTMVDNDTANNETLSIIAQSYYLLKDCKDSPAMDAVLTDLIKLNNKATYWNPLLRIERQDQRDDHDTLMIYRIIYNTHSMNADTDYIEMAQLLSDAALPAEAAAVLDKAMSSGAAGELLVELGELYYGFGEYHKTIDAITQGLQKGSVTQMDEALVYLGLAQLQLKSYAEAKSTFASIPGTSLVTPRVARLWRLYAGSLSAG